MTVLEVGDLVRSLRHKTSSHWYLVLDTNVGPYNLDYILLNTGKVINGSMLTITLDDWIDKGEAVLVR